MFSPIQIEKMAYQLSRGDCLNATYVQATTVSSIAYLIVLLIVETIS